MGWLWARRALGLAGFLVMGAGLAILPARAIESDRAAADAMLAMVNAWRVEEGLWPLQVNPVLAALALDQANFILPDLKDIREYETYHRDARGRMPPQRAVAAPYEWPVYGPDQIEIGENAGVGTARFVLGFWQESSIHRRAALSPAYREAGIAALPTRTGHLYMLVLGARPGVLTALASPAGDALFLSEERSRYAASDDSEPLVRLFDADGAPLGEALPWQLSLPLPEGAGESLFVLFSAGQQQSIRQVDLETDVALLPADLVAAAPTMTPSPLPATEAPATAAPQNENPPVAASPTLPAAAAQTPAAAQIDAPLLLLYDKNNLVIFNNGSAPLNLNGLVIGGAAGQVSVERWRALAEFPADAFPPGHCLLASRSGTSEPAPAQCKYVRSQIDLTPERLFWAAGSFSVTREGGVLASCEASAGRCAVRLP